MILIARAETLCRYVLIYIVICQGYKEEYISETGRF